jgi:hypothetical protein
VEEKVKVPPPPAQRETKQYEAAGKAVQPGAFFNDAPVVQADEYKGKLAMMQEDYYQIPVRKGQELRAVGIIQKTRYEMPTNGNHQDFGVAIYNSALQLVANEKVKTEDNPSEPVTIRATWTADADGVAYVGIGATDNYDKFTEGPKLPYTGRDTNIKYFWQAGIAPSPYTLRIRVEAEAAAAAAAAPIPSATIAGGNGYNNAAGITPPAIAVGDLKLGETAFYKTSVKKGDVLHFSAAFQKPWYEARGYFSVETTYTVTLFDDDQVQVGQGKEVVKRNVPEAHSVTLDLTAAMSGNVYVSISAKHTGNAEIVTEPQHPGRLAVQVTKEGGSPAPAAESEKPVESEKTGGTEKPAESKKSAENPFAGAESTPR